jgi:hypothetical protein
MARAHKRPHENRDDTGANYPPGLPLKAGKLRPYFTLAARPVAQD